MLASHYGARSPAFAHLVQTDAPPSPPSATTPPSSPLAPLIFDEPSVTAARARVAEWGIPGPCAFPITSMSTAGDQNQRSPLYVIGGDGRAIWTKELEVALAAGAVDAIIHCLKDVPTQLPDGLMLGAILEREDPRDALVIKAGLPYKVSRTCGPLQRCR
jgi:hydroxymethylbilane synthase